MSINKEKARWLWFAGDFEIYHGLLQNFQREERGFDWPAYWNLDDCHRNVKFKRYYDLAEPTTFTVAAKGQGYVEINEQKFPLGQPLVCPAGRSKIRVFVGNLTGLPTMYIEGSVIKSDIGWSASNFIDESPAGWSKLYLEREKDPNQVHYSKEKVLPVKETAINGGLLFDFGRAVNGTVQVHLQEVPAITLCYGESDIEALDVAMCYYKQEDVSAESVIRKRAFRYLFVPNVTTGQVSLSAHHEFLPLERKASFHSDNQLVNQIWDVSEETFKLCSDMFFIDGIKRDRWIWSGDAYQSYLINQYLFFDEDINKRTIVALRGQDMIKQHMNTIVDYSILWLISIENHYLMTKDREFLAMIYPKMVSMMNYLVAQTNNLGFIYGREKDWIFIDWSEMDKEGTLAAEQILLLKAYNSMIVCGDVLGKDINEYRISYDYLHKNLMTYFWDEDLGAFIDCYESGRKNVTRHANIFAVLYDFVTPEQSQSILENVLLNDEITQITTPYFKFFEQDALCKLGETARVYETIVDYWGGMLAEDAVTFWEEYNPEETGADMYSMYGDPYGKSLCHAWGASPIYLLSRYFIGLTPTKPGYEEFTIEPQLELFDTLDCTLPIKDGSIIVRKENHQLVITTTKDGGWVLLDGEQLPLKANQPLSLSLAESIVK